MLVESVKHALKIKSLFASIPQRELLVSWLHFQQILTKKTSTSPAGLAAEVS